ncbi:MAG: MIP/aquaporin family protein [Flavobacteriaceae bacterium]|nr:MIP/aquaporin family protein [Flavobacteriaceae bacterium]
MTPFLAELLGTFLLILFGGGVVANVNLKETYAHQSGWIVIVFGWAIGVFVGVFVAGSISGAHLNPAVTLGLALAGSFAWSMVPMYLLAQLLGAFLGAVLVWIHFKPHFHKTEDAAAIKAVFCTAPAIKHTFQNVLSETIGTFALVFPVFYISGATIDGQSASLGALDALPVALLVLGIGLSLGGTTGYAINPARDLGPRIAHALLPIKNKGTNDWKYAWIPVAGPFVGASLAALLFLFLQG